jgi:hypothetical protein
MKTSRISLVAALALLALPVAAQVPSGTFTVAPASGAGSVTPVLTWNITNATSCVAGGDWSGPKPAAGTETLPATQRSRAYTLTCVGPTPPIDGRATLSWIPPTQNTDGSPLTDLAAYLINYGPTVDTMSQTERVTNPSLTSYTISGLTAGTWVFEMRSENLKGLVSVPSNRSTKVIAQLPPQSAAFNAAVTVDTIPNPPTGLQTVETVAYDLRLDCSNWFSCLRAYLRDDFRLNQVVGTVALGVACTPELDVREPGFERVARSAVTLTRSPRSAAIVARCA